MTTAFNIKNKATSKLYSRCACGCNAEVSTPPKFQNAGECMEFIKWIKGLNLISSEDLWVPTVFVDDSWKTRELQRFRSGEYQPPVWYSEPWYKEVKEKVFDKYFPHVSLNNTEVIAITESPEKGMQDIQTPVKPGKFLKRFFGKVLTDEQIQEWANRHTEEWSKGPVLKLARTPEEILTVYEMRSGFSSCMQKPVNHFSPLFNPTQIYGYGDLALAYITDKKDKLLARALIWPEKKLVGRIYGDAHRLRAALKHGLDIETESNNVNYATFIGAKLDKIAFEGGWIAPFVDGSASLRDCGDHLELVGNSYSAGVLGTPHNQNGYIGTGKICQNCKMEIKKRYYRVYQDDTLKETRCWCSSCTGQYTFSAEHEGKLYIFNRDRIKKGYIATYDKNGEVHVGKATLSAFIDKDKYVIDRTTNYFIDKTESIQVAEKYFMHQYTVKAWLATGRLFKSDLDGQLYAHEWAAAWMPTKVGNEIWTHEQALKFGKYNEKKGVYEPAINKTDGLFAL